MEHTTQRSVWGTSTDEFKVHFRQYLEDLAKDDDDYRRALIQRLEWCFDRWDYWRQKFFSETAQPLLFPFFQSSKQGTEFGHYSTVGDRGEPSVIHIKRQYLMGERDVTVWKLSKTKRLVLKADHPKRDRYVDFTILHELVHQFLHEGASPETTRAYEAEASWKTYKGHGPLFAAECNRINETLHQELGFEFVPVRHSKKSHAAVRDVQRPSCAQFTHGELFWCWDPSDKNLSPEQLEDNRLRLQQALRFFDGAVVLVEEAEESPTDFIAPFDASCADLCQQELMAYDRQEKTCLVQEFHLAALKQMQASGDLDYFLGVIGHSTAPLNIQPADGEESGEPEPTSEPPLPVVVETSSEPTVPTERDTSPVSLVDEDTVLDITKAYPLEDPYPSLTQLNKDIKTSKLTNAAFAQQMFGHKNGQQLSRHKKRLREAIHETTGVAA